MYICFKKDNKTNDFKFFKACIGAILSSLLSKLVLLCLSLVILLCNFLGYFWIYMASKSRNEENSSNPGSPNYCAKDIWYMAHITIYSLFIIYALMILRMFASFYWHFILTEEEKFNVMKIGMKDSSKIEKV